LATAQEFTQLTGFDYMARILVVHHSTQWPLRTTIADHLYCFERHSSHRVLYLNIGVRGLNTVLLRQPFDLIIFHTTFLSQRAWNPETFAETCQRLEPLRRLPVAKAALPQDEFLNTDLLCDFINDFGVQHVFSVMPEREWPNIYHKVDRSRVRIHRVLTGYLEDATLARIEHMRARIQDRPIGIGYRSWHAAYWLGRHGQLKVRVAEMFQEHAPSKGIACDISTRAGDTFFGDSWYEFLLKSRYTIGVEGGASILDRDGTLKRKTEVFLKEKPRASFEETEAQCFPGLDGSAELFAISPRHLEACATSTCQVLIDGEYNGILKAGDHYIALKRDFSNLDDVLESISSDRMRAGICARAYRDIVVSGKYTYLAFVQQVLGAALPASAASDARPTDVLRYRYNKVLEALCRPRFACEQFMLRVLRFLVPKPFRSFLRRMQRLGGR
jgi:hypothetical protein